MTGLNPLDARTSARHHRTRSHRMSEGDPGKNDSATPSHPPELIVGIGASAGGITALKEFFTHVSPATGVAYVVILHLAADHQSRLAEVLQTATRMPVSQARGQVAMLPNRVYVIPPNAN